MKKLLEKVSCYEEIELSEMERKISSGKIVVPVNNKRKHISMPAAIGEGMKVKVNANIGGSPDISDVDEEINKLKAAVEHGADTVMDLTIGKEWEKILKIILEKSDVPVGTVPIYAAVCDFGIKDLDENQIIDVIEKQAELGVDFMTIHAGVTQKTADIYDKSQRKGGIVSRGGKLLYRWMKQNKKENPLYSNFDKIMEIASKYNVTISLGDGLRPGCISDACDAPQYAELEVSGELTEKCRDRNIQVMVEGPGHVPLDKIEENVIKEKQICKGAPFYVLGPLTCDIGAGHDHITGAIGGAFAAWKGADFLCYLTPAEHLHLPDINDVVAGVIATKIAAHSANIAKGMKKERDDKMSVARRKLDWGKMERYALDHSSVRKMRKKYPERKDRACTMCGEFCALLDTE
ncbi:MAG: phosphomethylpyrimidine synthase ThiC [Elusimicrobiota bacterium]